MARERLAAEDQLEISRLIAEYCQTFDRSDFDAFLALFTLDASFTRMNSPPAAAGGSGLPQETVSGHSAIRALLERAQAGFRNLMRHQQTNIVIDPDGEGRARSTSYGLITDWRDGPGRIAMFAAYHCRFVKTVDGWRFAAVAIDLLPKAPLP